MVKREKAERAGGFASRVKLEWGPAILPLDDV